MRITKMRAMLFLLGMAAILSDGTGEGLAKALMGTLLVFGPMAWAVYLLSGAAEAGAIAVETARWTPPDRDHWQWEHRDAQGYEELHPATDGGMEPYPMYACIEEGHIQNHEGAGCFRIN